MRMADIVQQLRRVLPGKTDLFHQAVGVSSINATASLATVTTADAHGLATGRVYDLDGRLLGTCTQEGLMRWSDTQ